LLFGYVLLRDSSIAGARRQAFYWRNDSWI
jgi:hypothetical protein